MTEEQQHIPTENKILSRTPEEQEALDQRLLDLPERSFPKYDYIEEALKQGADPGVRFPDRKPLLVHLAEQKEDGCVELLLKADVDPDLCGDDRNTSLHVTMSPRAIRALMDMGANPLLLNDEKKTPYEAAKARGNAEYEVQSYTSRGVDALVLHHAYHHIAELAEKREFNFSRWVELWLPRFQKLTQQEQASDPNSEYEHFEKLNLVTAAWFTLPYALGKMAENGVPLTKEFLLTESSERDFLFKCALKSRGSLASLLGHIAEQEAPFTTDELVGLFQELLTPALRQVVVGFFAVEAWKNGGSAPAMVEFFKHTIKAGEVTLSQGHLNYIYGQLAECFTDWLKSPKDVPLRVNDIQTLYRQLPPEVQGCIPNLHVALARASKQTIVQSPSP